MTFAKTGILACAMSAMTLCSAAPVTLVEEGRSVSGIVLPEKTSPADDFALNDLKEYIKKASGADLSVVRLSGDRLDGARIYLGIPPPGVRLRDGERIIKTADGNLYLYGSGYDGNLAAVHRFLEKGLGCRWWDAYGYETVPRTGTICVKMDFRWEEILPYRSLMTFFHTKANAHRFYVRNGQNLLLGQDVAGANRIIPAGKGNHSFHKFVPPEKYFKDHPEFFPLDASGKRQSGPQLCFSSPELRETMTENVIADCREKALCAAEKGQECWIEVSVMDVPGPFCHCAGCKERAEKYQTPGGAFFEYLPELCRAVGKEMPNARIVTLLYRKEQTEKPPVGIVFPENLVGIFAPIDDNIFAPLDHKSNRETLEHLRQWCRIAGNIWVWYYPDTYTMTGPYSALRRTIRDFHLMKEAGITGTFYEHDVTPPDSRNFADLGSWVMLKLFSGAGNPDALIREFMDANYGRASNLMFSYFNELEDLREKAVREGVVGYYACSPVQLNYFTSQNLEKWSGMFDRMEELVKADDADLFRVRLVRRMLDELILRKWESFSETSGYAGKITPRILRDRIAETVTRIEKERRPHVSQSGELKDLDALVEQPLPPELKGIDPRKVRQLYYTTGEKDPAAVFGFAARHKTHVAFPYGMYANDYRSHLSGSKITTKWTLLKQRLLEKDEVTADCYRLYRIGRFPITNATRVSTTGNAFFFRDVSIFFSKDAPSQEWDVYLSLKFEGPAVPGSRAEENSVSCDRIVLVKADSPSSLQK